VIAIVLIAASAFGLGALFGASRRRAQVADLTEEREVWRELATELHEEGCRLRLFSLVTRRGRR
jgi:hypothetical protein